MRVFKTLATAADEIQRDIYKAGKMNVSRVQQWDHLELIARESFGYSYTILPGGIPDGPKGLIDIGINFGMPAYQDFRVMLDWLIQERDYRLNPLNYDQYSGPAEKLHPALRNVYEGDHPSYVYRERMVGMIPTVVDILKRNRDSRRAYWSIWQPTDSFRAGSPTRVPCSLGYQFAIRTMPDGDEYLICLYSQRSSDFDNFWLSDVWLAYQAQLEVATLLRVKAGTFTHMIHSFHSFEVGEQEIY